uniref:Very-long-chain enoyl-CoA reductase n=1 Tax=Ursus americanus TaxID=9643 RepID=A0A452RSG5_URSAM
VIHGQLDKAASFPRPERPAPRRPGRGGSHGSLHLDCARALAAIYVLGTRLGKHFTGITSLRPHRGPGARSALISALIRRLAARRSSATRSQKPHPAPLDARPATSAQVEILDAKTREKLCFLDKVEPHATIAEIKNLFTKTHPQWYPARQSLRLDPKGKSLKDEDVLQKLPVGTTATLYFRDLGAQISWVTVFLTEYAGPLFIYLLFYFRVPFIYGHKYDFTSSRHTVVHLACICHSFHYVKRLLETLFVHRFSHGTMPLRNIFKNCTYYWGFAAWMAYYINHPLYTPPTYGAQQVKLALAIFVICQLGNFSIHMALRDLRPAGSKTRKIPYPTKNPFTWLFLLVSCPNYTYEVGSWIGFAIMTQCLPVALFSLVGFTQMTIWAKGKHRSYLKEFRDYPPLRMPIIPFLL